MRIRIISPLRPKVFHPPRGEKQIYLPNFTLTLLRTPHAPPHFASFLTPLYLNKLDLKDYLWHGYGLQVLNVRSFVIHAKVRVDKPSRDRPSKNRWYRPRATKKMTVELTQNAPGQGPFIWPDPPTDLSPWDKKTWDRASEAQKTAYDNREDGGKRVEPTDGSMLAEQARKLREGHARWVPGFEDYGGARVEVQGDRGEGKEQKGGQEGTGVATEAGWRFGRSGR